MKGYLISNVSAVMVWLAMVAVPYLYTLPSSPIYYEKLIPKEWYTDTVVVDEEMEIYHSFAPTSLVGLPFGVCALVAAKLALLIYHDMYTKGHLRIRPMKIQISKPTMEKPEDHLELLRETIPHLMFLIGLAKFRLLPPSYQTLEGGIQWNNLWKCLLVHEIVQSGDHYLVHYFPSLYRHVHKFHHQYLDPNIYDTGRMNWLETIPSLTLPTLAITQLVRTCNFWTFLMAACVLQAFGHIIHSEYSWPWDNVFRQLGLGTPGDHHVHHQMKKYNYGFACTWIDRIFGTYLDPRDYPNLFRLVPPQTDLNSQLR